MSTFIGWFGSICLALCGAPQAFHCIRQGHARGLSPLFLGLWFSGEVCYVTAVLMEFGWVAWMLTNYLLNIIFVLVMFKYLIWPRE